MHVRSYVFACLSSLIAVVATAFGGSCLAIREFFVCLPALVGVDAVAVDRMGHSVGLDAAPRIDRRHRSFLARVLSHARFFGDGFKLDGFASPA